ncbi:MAG: hypothetical protein KAU62_13970 [Candidatus Heimdallarchaeota archaeon]|nr:hypothetical protein [Candidatus Heimdallarchaeota archaeon]MCK4612258.1 hypothetical protein [Candidatus Heimdallarchaeota archaeon]
MSELKSKRSNRFKKKIKEFFLSAWNLERFNYNNKEKRKEVVVLIRFKFEVISVFVIIYALFREYFSSKISLIFTGEDVYTKIAIVCYVLLILICTPYVFLRVLYRHYLVNRDVPEMVINISYFMIFAEIIASIGVLLCIIFFGFVVLSALVGGLMLTFVTVIFYTVIREIFMEEEEENEK